MKLFVTGGAGFIGGNYVLKQVLEEGNEVLNFDKLTYAGNLETLKSIIDNPQYQFIQGDICQRSTVKNALYQFQPDVIVNFAAESHVDRSIDGPFEFIQTNIVGTAVLLDEANNYFKTLSGDIKAGFRFLHVSTDEVYGSLGEDDYFTENTAYDPSSPYSASKASSDHFVKAFFKTYNLPVIVSNCSNNYGPWQYKEKLIPTVVSSIIQNKRIPVYGKGLNVRDWIHVDDHISAINLLIKKGVIGESYCIGSNNELSNIKLIKKICKISDKLLNKDSNSFDLVEFVEDRLGHDIRYSIDSNKLKKLGWKTNVSFDESLQITIKWYIENPEWII